MLNIVYIIILAISFATCFFMVPVSIRFAKKYDILDKPDPRRVHKVPTPRIGGIALVSGTLIGVICYIAWILITDAAIDKRYIGYLLGAIIIAGMGFVDDIKSLKPLYKFLFQLLSGMVIYIFGISIVGVKIPFIYPQMIDFGIWSFPITLMWVLGITNAVNLIDGLDGLADGISAIASISFLIIFALNGSPVGAIIIALALVGATLGFLPYNFNPAKTFMGDTGSNFLGYTLATISIIGMAKGYTVLAIIAPLIVVGVPVFDMVFAIFRRLAHHQKITAPDKNHIHHRLLRHGFSQRQAVLILYSITCVLGVIAVTLVSKRIIQGVMCIAIFLLIIAIGLIADKHKKKIKENMSNIQNMDNENTKKENV